MLRISSNIREIEIQLHEIESNILNFTPLWDRLIEKVIVNGIDESFDTQGFGAWPQRKDALPHPLLELTGRLRDSLTSPNAQNNINRQSPDSLEYGSDLFYYVFHEEGTNKIPKRPVFSTLLSQPQFEKEIENEIENYFQDIIDNMEA